MTMQVADVGKVLTSTARVCDAGNIQIFTKNGGWIVNEAQAGSILAAIEKAGNKLQMERTGGTYVYDIWVPKAAANGNGLFTENRYQALGAVEDSKVPVFSRLGDELI